MSAVSLDISSNIMTEGSLLHIYIYIYIYMCKHTVHYIYIYVCICICVHTCYPRTQLGLKRKLLAWLGQ